MLQYQSKPRTITIRIPNLQSGLYYALLTGPDGRVGYAPFVVRPTILGATSRVLVVLPTNTWQAYNFQDVDGNGYGARGTRDRRTAQSISGGRTSRAVCRRASTATTCRSCIGSTGRASRRSSSPTRTST